MSRPSRGMLLAGILGNSSIVLLYLATRALDVPLFGPETGEVEAVGALDACATLSEVALVGALGALLFWHLLRQRGGSSCSWRRWRSSRSPTCRT